jgi:hypothetical protein
MDESQVKTLSSDTDPETEAVWLAMLRGLPAHRKFAQVRSLTETVLTLSRRAIARKHPNASEDELAVLFIRYQYGDTLADEFKQHLRTRDHMLW